MSRCFEFSSVVSDRVADIFDGKATHEEVSLWAFENGCWSEFRRAYDFMKKQRGIPAGKRSAAGSLVR